METNKTNSSKGNILNSYLMLADDNTKIILADKFLNKKIVSIFKDQDLIESAEAFFDNNLNISETSRNTFMHRNTLIYRIEKIERITGLNIRNLNDAVSFMFMKAIYDKTKNVR